LVLAVAASVRTLHRPAKHTVFPLFVAGAQRYAADLPLYQKQPGLDYFRYPPLFAIVITPLGWLGLRAGGVLWAWVSCAVLLAGLWRFARAVLPDTWREGRTALFLALAAVGSARGVWNGQSNALIVGLLLLGAVEIVRRRWWRSAFLLSASVWLKLTPLAPVLLLGALWPRRLAPRLLVALALLALVPFLTRPPEIVCEHYRDWFAHLVGSSTQRWPGFRDAWTVWEVTRYLFTPGQARLEFAKCFDSAPYRALQLLTAGATAVWCLWQKRQGAGPCRLVTLTLAMGCAWLMLFGPAVEHSTYVFLAAPLSWALLAGHEWRGGRWLIATAFLLVMVLGWGTLTTPVAAALPVIEPGIYLALPVGTALFIVWLIGFAGYSLGNSAARNASIRTHTSRTSADGLLTSLPVSSRKPWSLPA
jgi:hypothetical protein